MSYTYIRQIWSDYKSSWEMHGARWRKYSRKFLKVARTGRLRDFGESNRRLRRTASRSQYWHERWKDWRRATGLCRSSNSQMKSVIPSGISGALTIWRPPTFMPCRNSANWSSQLCSLLMATTGSTWVTLPGVQAVVIVNQLPMTEITASGSSVRLEYFPSSAIPTTCIRLLRPKAAASVPRIFAGLRSSSCIFLWVTRRGVLCEVQEVRLFDTADSRVPSTSFIASMLFMIRFITTCCNCTRSAMTQGTSAARSVCTSEMYLSDYETVSMAYSQYIVIRLPARKET